MDELHEAVLKGEQELMIYRQQNELTETNGLTLLDQQIAETNTELTAAAAEVRQAEANRQEVSKLLRLPAGAASVGQVLASPLIQELREQEALLQQREVELSTHYGSRHPLMQDVQAQRVGQRRKIDEEIGRIVQSLRSESAIVKKKEAALEARLAGLQQKRAQRIDAEVVLGVQERDVAANRALYASYIEKFKELSAQEHSQEPDARLLSAAAFRLTPRLPSTRLWCRQPSLPLLALACWWRFRLLGFDRGSAIPRRPSRASGNCVSFGLIPDLGRRPRPLELIARDPTGLYPEAVQSAFAAFQCYNRAAPPKVLMVTSSLPGEGK